MGGARFSRRSGRAIAGLVATILGLLLSLAPPIAGVVRAATSKLVYDATSTYTLDPAGAAVHVVVQLKVTDKTPNSGAFIYFYDTIGLAIETEASNVHVTDASGAALKVTTKNFPPETIKGIHYLAGKDVVAHLRQSIFYNGTANLRFTYDLVGGPRSTTQVRVGPAFATFPTVVQGDPPHDVIKIVLPTGWTTKLYYTSLVQSATGSTVTYALTPSDPLTAWSVVYATNDAAYASGATAVPGALPVSIESLPGDADWTAAVNTMATTELPDLAAATGLAWDTAPVRLREAYIPDFLTVPDGSLGATAIHYGSLTTAQPALVTLPETLDPFELLTGTAGYWFNSELFTGRWLDTGLAREMASRVLKAHGTTVPDPTAPTSSAGPLGVWNEPSWNDAVDIYQNVKQAAATEAERTSGSWYVVRSLLTGLSDDQVRSILGAAKARTNPYVGAGPAEAVSGVPGWQRLVDLIEEAGGSTDIEATLKASVLVPSQGELLATRTKARTDYAALVAAGHGWLPPAAVRTPMASWDFTAAQAAMTAATQALALQATIAAAEQAAGAPASTALKAAYEGAETSFDAALALGNDELASLGALSDGAAAVAAPRDLMTTIGLIGVDPAAPLVTAKAAYGSGDLAGVKAGAAAATAAISGAKDTGQQRLVLGVAVVVGLLLLLAVVVLLRRRRRGAAVRATTAVAGPYGTLPADPDSAAPLAAAEAGQDGGSSPDEAQAGTS